ncbi:MAG: 50S ribosomal protein L2 [Candidatus Marsarchaeota archaeon]|jgi:large subunit ribosomal protein L2|nr:50S ribosomal protein L2 [Candidatus Marsarchaeota archaeon]
MGKKLKQQRRGKGSPAYRKAPGTFDISVGYTPKRDTEIFGEVINIIHHTGHTAPLVEVCYEDMSRSYLLAPEGIKKGDKILINTMNYSLGNVIKLKNIPEGISIYNIESRPGDGGKLVRAAGSSAYIASHINNMVTIIMPSKQQISLSDECRAQLGAVAGGGMNEQPIMKAGKNHYIMHAINKLWPTYRGVKLNPVDHPFGGKQHHKGKSSMTSRNAPPGRKVGHIAASRVGRKKRG